MPLGWRFIVILICNQPYEGFIMKKAILFIGLVSVAAMAGNTVLADAEFKKSYENGTLRKLFNQTGELEGIGDAKLVPLGNKIAKAKALYLEINKRHITCPY